MLDPVFIPAGTRRGAVLDPAPPDEEDTDAERR